MAVSEKMIHCVKVSDSSWHDLSQGECDKKEEGGAAYSSPSPAAEEMISSEHKRTKKRHTSVLPWKLAPALRCQ